MSDCTQQNNKLFGGAVVLEVADGCEKTPPSEADWKSLMAGTSKGLDFSPNTVTSDADDQGGFVESIVTNSDISLPFEGEVRTGDKLDEYGFYKFERNFATAIANKSQPSIWVRLMHGENIFIGYMNITSFSWSGGTNELVKASLEFKTASSETIQIIQAP